MYLFTYDLPPVAIFGEIKRVLGATGGVEIAKVSQV